LLKCPTFIVNKTKQSTVYYNIRKPVKLDFGQKPRIQEMGKHSVKNSYLKLDPYEFLNVNRLFFNEFNDVD